MINPETIMDANSFYGEPPKAIELTKEQLSIMEHTKYRAASGLYCGDSDDMKKLVELGLMESAGTKLFVLSEYFKLTKTGKDFLKEKGI